MEIVQFDENKEITLEPCIFILFAEYLGYVSPFIEWAEKSCKTDDIEQFKTDILTKEALYYLSEMKKEYSEVDLRKWFNAFDELFISHWKQLYNTNHPSTKTILKL